MAFRRSIQRYGQTPEPETPYSRAGQVWDQRLGSAHAQAFNWRLTAMGSLLLSFGLGGGIIWIATQSHVVPFVVTVDHLGEARAIGPVDPDYQPEEPQIAWFLAHFIRDVRTVSLDPVLMRANWLEAYGFATNRASSFLNMQARSADPFAAVGTRTVSVGVSSVVRISERSFQVKWIEQVFVHGNLTETGHWTGILTIIVTPPASAEVLRRNPLGLYVDAVDWSRELSAPEPGTANSSPDALAAPPARKVDAPSISASDAPHIGSTQS